MLSDVAKRLPVFRDPIPDEVTRYFPSSPLELDEHRFRSVLRGAKLQEIHRGCLVENLRSVLCSMTFAIQVVHQGLPIGASDGS